MPYLEQGSFCNSDEYDRHVTERVQEADYEAGELHMIMFRLDDPELEAAKLPARVEKITKSGAYVVRFAFLDNDLNPKMHVEATISNGYISAYTPHMTIAKVGTDHKMPILQSYARDYFDDLWESILKESTSLVVN